MKPSPWLFASLAFFALAAACAGGGSTPAPPASDPNGSGSNAKLDQSVKFMVVVPRMPGASSRRRKTKSTVYISPNTESITIQIGAVDGISLKQPPAPTVANVPANCIGSATGCSVAIAGVVAAAGTDTFVVSTFAGPSGSGTLVSQGVVALQVSGGGGSGTIGGTTLSLGGFVQSISLTVTPDYFIRGRQSNAQVVVEAKDATGAIIIGNTRFAVPIALGATPSPQLQITGLPFQNGVPVLTESAGHGHHRPPLQRFGERHDRSGRGAEHIVERRDDLGLGHRVGVDVAAAADADPGAERIHAAAAGRLHR